ncbi:hypothetical protein D3C71_1920110 [compost metagenome]
MPVATVQGCPPMEATARLSPLMPPAPIGSLALMHRMLTVSMEAARVLSLALDSGTDVKGDVIGQ